MGFNSAFMELRTSKLRLERGLRLISGIVERVRDGGGGFSGE
jgi:hypothetical protein